MSGRKRPLFAANWKMHKGPEEAARFVEEFAGLYDRREDRRLVFFPPTISLGAFRGAARNRPDLEVGVQDVHEEAAGAHTGAVSASMAAQAGAEWSLAGHSERRREFGDDDERVRQKVLRILEAGLRPVVCVGETLEEREGGKLRSVLARQVEHVLNGVAGDRRASLTWAYEPVWAIGTGRTASPEDAAEAHALLRAEVARLATRAVAEGATVLYGGSVKPENIEELMAAAGVDGVLVGGASLDPAAFARICAVRLSDASS